MICRHYPSDEIGLVPNNMAFQITVTNFYLNLRIAPLSLSLQSGLPSYWAVALDTNDFTGAHWNAYVFSNITANLGAVQGWHTIWVGLRGSPYAPPFSVPFRLCLDTIPPVLTVTNPTPGTVMQPMIQLQGYANEELASLSFDLTNALGALSNQTGFITGYA